MPRLSFLQVSRRLRNARLLPSIELEQFAAFGRISANLIHEVINPLTAATLNLEQSDGHEQQMIIEARKNLKQLERYVEAARQQLKAQGQLTSFSVRAELQRLRLIMEPQARRSQVRLTFEPIGNLAVFGDPVKFNQLVANLIANSLDAYGNTRGPETKRLIRVTARQRGQWLIIRVSDWGGGIPTEALPLIFQPFYTTKEASSRGTGLGLATVKRIAEQDFRGFVTARSSRTAGTHFVVKLRNYK